MDHCDDAETFEIKFGDDEESLGAIAALNRGLIVASYAHVEFVLTDFLVRCSNVVEYLPALPGALPYSLEKRLTGLRRIFTLPGPLSRYQTEATALIDKLLSFEELRHMMSHGLMVLYYDSLDPGSTRIRFRRYDFGPKKSLLMYVTDFTLLELCQRQSEVSKYSNEVIGAMARILEETGLPTPPAELS